MSSVRPMRNLQVTGMPCGVASATAARMMARIRLRFTGTAAPPPLRVTFWAGQPKFMSMWSTRSLRHSSRTARPTNSGSLPYICRLRKSSSGPNPTILRVRSFPWTRAAAMTISET